MKITFLGTGSAYGTPLCGNYWDSNVDTNCIKNLRTRNSILIDDDFLIDCSPDFREHSIRYNLKNIKNIFYTHWHADHIFGTWELEQYVKNFKNRINIFSDFTTNNKLMHHYEYFLKNNEMFKLFIFNNFQKINVNNRELTVIKFFHGNIESFGFRYKDMLISPDMDVIPEESEEYLNNLELWIMECNNFDNHNRGGHTSLQKALERMEKYKPKNVILTHFSYHWDFETAKKYIPDNVKIAFDGMSLCL